MVTVISRDRTPGDETRSRHHHFARGAKSLQSEPGPTLGRNGRPHIYDACGEAGAEENQPNADIPKKNVAPAGRAPHQAGAQASAQWNAVHLIGLITVNRRTQQFRLVPSLASLALSLT